MLRSDDSLKDEKKVKHLNVSSVYFPSEAYYSISKKNEKKREKTLL